MPVTLPNDERQRRLAEIDHQLKRIDRVFEVDPKASLTVMRELTELLLTRVLEDHLGSPKPGCCISALDQQLSELQALPRRVRASVGQLQMLGNLGAHHQTAHEEPRVEEATAARAALHALVAWYRSEHLGVEREAAPWPAPRSTPDQPRMKAPQLERARRYNRHGNFNPAFVAQVQRLLELPEHGRWDDGTIQGLYAFQVRDGALASDGMLGPSTLRAVQDQLRRAGIPPTETFALTPERRDAALTWNLGRGLSTARVTQIQHLLEVPATGRIDEGTTEAIFRWQLDNGLGPDAMLGPLTLSRMMAAVESQATRNETD